MKSLEEYIVYENCTVREAIEKMEESGVKALVCVDEMLRVRGLFSNGDMRKYFLRGGSLNEDITVAMNSCPVLFHATVDAKYDYSINRRVLYPIVDEVNTLVGIYDPFDIENCQPDSTYLKDVPLVIMAGGKGTRLLPYTRVLPKALIPIGDMTILERIIDSFRKYGCKKVLMVLNHKAGMIKSYMTELDKDYTVDFVMENDFLGTAGGLNLLKDKLKGTFFLSNCDILINDDMECAYKTHVKKGNMITFICSMKDIIVPYGVVETTPEGLIREMNEKPSFSFLVNTGVYLVERQVLDLIDDNEKIGMPDLAQKVISSGGKVGVFPISEKAWMDMGQISEMNEMLNFFES